MLVIAALLASFAFGLLLVLVKAFSQNRGLWGELQAGRRSVPSLLWDALVLWSPLALLIVVLAFAANRLGAAAVSLSYRLTTLDQFCEVEGIPGPVLIPCTGMDGVLARRAVRLAGPQADLEYFLSGRYRQARQRLMALPADELQRLAANRPAFASSLSPRSVLALEQAPEDDPDLVRLKQQLRELVSTPTPPAHDVFDLLRFVSERDSRVQRIRAQTAQVLARREAVNHAAYAGLPRQQQARLWWRHRVSHLLATVPAGEQPAQGSSISDSLITLARGEASAAGILAREANSRTGAEGLYLALPMPRRCTVAAADDSLRLRASDFADDGFKAIAADRFIQSNSGTFACFSLAGAADPVRVHALGFRESVQRSIDRWHDQVARASFRRMGQLSLEAGAGALDAQGAARAMSLAVPTGIHLGRADCGLLHLDNCAANLAREGAEAGYARARADMARQYEREAGAAAGAVAQTLDQHIGQALLTLDAQLEGMRRSAHEYANRLFIVSFLLRVLGWLALAVIAVKSFLYVLALELFHSDEDMAIGFDGAPAIDGEYRSGRQLTIDRDFPQPLITRKQLSNTDNNVCVAPWPWSSPLTRILRGRYFIFTKGSFLADAGPQPAAGQEPRGMVASAGSGQSIVEWKLRPGEQVIFRYQDFHGASENVRLSSEWSFRLATLLLGRVRFHIASCPDGEGRLLLRANVEEIDQQHIRAVPPERMIAWSRHARFSIHSGRTLWKTLLNGYTLVRRDGPSGPNGLIVVSSDDVGSNLGSIRFVRRIFSAIF